MVTDEIVQIAARNFDLRLGTIGALRKSLEAIAPMLASADTPTELDAVRNELVDAIEERDYLRNLLASARVPDGWEYHKNGPEENGDQRCLCTIEQDCMVYVGVAIWCDIPKRWFQNGNLLVGKVIAWRPLPAPAKGRWVSGKLLCADDDMLAAAPKRWEE